MRTLRLLAVALALLLAGAPPALRAQEPSPAAAQAAALQAPPTEARTGIPQRAAPPRTLRDYTHVFAAFAIAWLLLFGYVVSLGRRWSRVERELAARA